MSSPHFYQADETFVQDVFGMTPKKEQHQTMIDINPVGISASILKGGVETKSEDSFSGACSLCTHFRRDALTL